MTTLPLECDERHLVMFSRNMERLEEDIVWSLSYRSFLEIGTSTLISSVFLRFCVFGLCRIFTIVTFIWLAS